MNRGFVFLFVFNFNTRKYIPGYYFIDPHYSIANTWNIVLISNSNP